MSKNLAIAFIGNNIFYHLGVIKAIDQYSMYNKFNAVSGIGLGSLSAIMFAKENYKLFKELSTLINNTKRTYIEKNEIYNILNMHILDKSLNEKIYIWSKKISKEGMINWSDMLKIINHKYISIDNSHFRMNCYLVCYELPFMKKSVFKLNECDNDYIHKVILNSVAEPVIFNNKVKSKSFITGDINTKLSIEALKDNNYKSILIVDSDNMKIEYKSEHLKDLYVGNFNNKIICDTSEKYIERAYEDGINIIKNALRNTA